MKIKSLILAVFMLIATKTMRAQVAVAPLSIPRAQFLSSTGVPVAAGCVNFFATGTSNPQAIYADSGGVNQLSNPLTLDAAGEASVWLTNTGYDIVLNTGVTNTACSVSLGTQLWREVNKNPFAIINSGSNYIVASGTSDPSGTAGEFAFRSDLPCLRFFIATWDCVAELSLSQTLTNKTIDISLNTVKTSSNVAGHYPRNNGVQYLDSVIQSVDLPSASTLASVQIANASVTGTSTGLLAKLTGTPSTALTAAITDTSGIVGVCLSGCGTTGNAQISTVGLASCVFDGAIVAGDYVQISSTVAGNCHDIGSSYPSGGQAIGRVLSSNAGGGTYLIDLFPAEIKAPANGVAVVQVDRTGLAANIGATPLTTPPANGFYRASCYTVVTQAATNSSTSPTCAVLWTDADSSSVESYTLNSGSSSNNVGQQGVGTAVPSYGFYAKTGVAITYQTTGYLSSGATPMQYAIHLRLEGPF